MGQYYRTLLVFEDGSERCATAHDYDNGVKLMEHSWVGNDFVNAILGAIEDNPARVAWVGDYSTDSIKDGCNLGNGFITSRSQFEKVYSRTWSGGRGKGVRALPKTDKQYDFGMDSKDCYIVNKTKRCFVDLERYIKENSVHKYGGIWAINPLPLLTAVGNGLGGGDFRGPTGMEQVGTWAFDEIYVSSLCPSKWDEAMYHFRESSTADHEEEFPF